ncbi:MAG TPA: FGGY-family carbohydrate kinase [Vicinamibacterales bacterium]|nr:FGGY-family carbohydrate kinase [Vicinamibacterales bacterium]
MPLYLGLDSSTQSLTAIVIEVAPRTRRVVWECSLNFDDILWEYGTRRGVYPHGDPAVVVAPPLMWAKALETVCAWLGMEIPPQEIAAVSGSAQQHGSVYLGADRRLTRDLSPIWMDSSTTAECREIEAAVGGAHVLAQHTGSRAFERFTAAQIRKFWHRDADAYGQTAHIHLVSSFLASLLIGRHAPIDRGDASGMNLMDLATSTWWAPAVDACAPGLAGKLPQIVDSSTVIGTMGRWWQRHHRFSPARVVAWTGDNPSSLVGTGLVRRDRVAISLGTSDTIFGPMAAPSVDASGTGHVFASPTGGFMGLTCFRNGSLARERVRNMFGFTWSQFSDALAGTPVGNNGAMLLPWFEPEITPDVPRAGMRTHALDPTDAAAHMRAVIEGQAMALWRHSQWMGGEVREIYATGGASVNRAILQVIADVFGADVYQFQVSNSAALGAAMRATHADLAAAGTPVEWSELAEAFASPIASSRVRPDPASHAIYERLRPAYADFEARARKHD